jgi:uncharacterized protein YpmB
MATRIYRRKTLRQKAKGILVILFTVIIITALYLVLSSANNMQSNGPISTEKQAIKIALPLVKAFTKENNLATTTTKATFIESTNNPYWFVEIGLNTKENTDPNVKRYAYTVAIWADTGKIYHHGPMQITIGPKAPNDSREENVKITLDKAIEIALPLAQAYAQENNRIITTITSSCYLDSRSCWCFDINFEAIKSDKIDSSGGQYWIIGYQVSVWADTGEIQSHNVAGIR